MSRRRGTFDRRSLLGSLAVHAVLVAVIVAVSTAPPEPLDFVTYEIELVSPAPPARAPEPETAAEDFVVERPDPTPPPPPEAEAPAPIEPEPKPRPDPPEPTPDRTPPPPEPADRQPAAQPDAPEEPARETGESIEVRMEGLQRDYPEYYNNIIRQMGRCFQWTGADNLRAVIYFEILRDGSVRGSRIVQSSNSAMFDIEALGAAECAGNGKLGPLPDDLPMERFPIRFEFNPRRGAAVLPADPSSPSPEGM